MRIAEWIQITFASLLAVAAWVYPLPRERRARVSLLAVIVISAIAVARLLARYVPELASAVLEDWLPGALFFIPYWQTGQFFTTPNSNLQQRLAAFDRQLLRVLLPKGASLGKRLAGFFEIVYLTVYPLVPVGLGLLYGTGMREYADYYWTVVLLAANVCYAITPFVQALPPRLLSSTEVAFRVPRTAPRRLNDWLGRKASIGAITFPSAHVAAAMAVSLVLLQLLPLAGVVFVCLSIGIAMACVLGGYHYAADVLAGTLVAVLVFVSTHSMARG